MGPSNETVGFQNEIPVRNRSPTKVSTAENFDFDPTTETSHRSEETKMKEDEEKEDPEITDNAAVKTRSGRLSKRRHLDSNFSKNQVVNSSSSGASMNTESASSKSAKQRKIATGKKQASINRSSKKSSFSTFSTESEENMENKDVTRAEGNPPEYNG
ncbi:unnamed protein product [Caenorhabditis brenneri]